MLVLPPEKRMGKAPPDDVDSNWFDVVIAKETHEYQARALPPEIFFDTNGFISDLGSHLVWLKFHHVV